MKTKTDKKSVSPKEHKHIWIVSRCHKCKERITNCDTSDCSENYKNHIESHRKPHQVKERKIDLIIGEADGWHTICSDGLWRGAEHTGEQVDMLMDKLNELILVVNKLHK